MQAPCINYYYYYYYYIDEIKDDDAETGVEEKAAPILVDEVRKAIRRLPCEKSAGYDDLPEELIKLDSVIESVFCKLCNLIVNRTAAHAVCRHIRNYAHSLFNKNINLCAVCS